MQSHFTASLGCVPVINSLFTCETFIEDFSISLSRILPQCPRDTRRGNLTRSEGTFDREDSDFEAYIRVTRPSHVFPPLSLASKSAQDSSESH